MTLVLLVVAVFLIGLLDTAGSHGVNDCISMRRHTRAQALARAEHVGARTGGLGGSRLRELDHHSRDLTRSGFVLVRLLIEYLRRADEHG